MLNDEHIEVAGLEFKKFKYDGQAQEFYNAWCTELEQRLRNEAFISDAFAAHLGKFRKLFPSLSLIFFVADHPKLSQPAEMVIPLKYVKMAAWWCTYLEHQAYRLYTLYLETGDKAVELILERIKNKELNTGVTLRELLRCKWSGLTKASVINEALKELQMRNYLVVEDIQEKSGRPSTVLFINPRVYEHLEGQNE